MYRGYALCTLTHYGISRPTYKFRCGRLKRVHNLEHITVRVNTRYVGVVRHFRRTPEVEVEVIVGGKGLDGFWLKKVGKVRNLAQATIKTYLCTHF